MMNPNPAQFGGSFQPPQQPQQKGCLGRNWKWMLPVGCLGLILGLAALVGGIVFVAMSAIKSSEVYKGALDVVRTHPAAAERLGQPIKDGWFVQGNINFQGASGNANFDVPVSGPKNSGTLHVSAVYEDGAWMYQKLDLAAGGPTVSLLDRNVAQAPPGPPVDVEEDADGTAGDETGGEGGKEDVPGYEGQAAEAPNVVSGGVLNGKAVSLPHPPYPAMAKAARAQGAVVVRVTVDETGDVVSAEAASGHPLLRAAAVQAARQAKFSPTILGGKPVKVTGVLTYNFEVGQ